MKLFGRKKKEQPLPSPARPLIAIIDDEVDLCTLLGIALAAEGYEVASAHDGEAGLALIRERRPALILLDIKMPRMNGYQVLARLHQDAELSQIPVYIMTSLSDDKGTSDEEWARKLGVAHFSSKPLNIDRLVGLVRGQLGAGEGAGDGDGKGDTIVPVEPKAVEVVEAVEISEVGDAASLRESASLTE